MEQLDTATLLVGGVLSLSLLWWLSTRRSAGLPPGPGPALPLLGHIHLMDKDPRAKFHKWRRQYGDIFSLYIGTRLVVVFNGFPVIKEAFVKFADVFSDRPHMLITNKTGKEQRITKVVGELFSTGTESTATVIDWALLFLLHHPNIQDKCYKEICDLIGTNRLPNTRDRTEMVYLEATMNEAQRLANIVPFSVQHATSRDVSFRGYVIPKDAIILPFMDSVLHDPEVWGDPENFHPERFIGPDGKLRKPDEFIPFGIGPRMCLGVAMAQMELFLYLSTLIQHFRFLPEEPGMLPPLKGTLGASQAPLPYRIRAVRCE